MLRPRQKKFQKNNKGRINSTFEFKANSLKFGTHGIQALEKGIITAKQIEATRRSITNFIKRKGKVWIRIFPDFPITRKPNEVRMGKGKGNVAFWVCKIKPGRILFELAGPDFTILTNALKNASTKLPLAAKIISTKFL